MTSLDALNIQIIPSSMDQAQELFTLINNAYLVESGNSEGSFKKEGSLRYNTIEEFLPIIEGSDVSVAIDKDTKEIVGCIYAPTFIDDEKVKRLYFGPLASKRRGVGKVLVQLAEKKALEERCASIDIHVINVRTDVLPWYQKNGYVIIGEKPYPRIDMCTRDVFFYVLRKEV